MTRRWWIVAGVAVAVLVLGVGIGIGLLAPRVHVTVEGAKPAATPTPGTSGSAGGSGLAATPAATDPGTCDTSAPGSYDGCTLVAYPRQDGAGPALPDDYAGQLASCRVMADTGDCVDVYLRNPATGWCTELFFVAPKAPGTDQGWRDENSDPADYLCRD